jgi:hypothetical protein
MSAKVLATRSATAPGNERTPAGACLQIPYLQLWHLVDGSAPRWAPIAERRPGDWPPMTSGRQWRLEHERTGHRRRGHASAAARDRHVPVASTVPRRPEIMGCCSCGSS